MSPTEPYCPLWKRGLRLVRRRVPHLLALLLFLGYWKYTQLQTAHRAAVASAVESGRLNADDAQVLEAVQANVPPLGDAVGKSIIAAGGFFGGLVLVWFILGYIIPVLPDWAKGKYTASAGDFKTSFLALSDPCKLSVFQTLYLGLLAYWSVCFLAAALIK